MSEREKLKVSTRVVYDELVKQNASVRIIDAASSLLEFHDTAGDSHLIFSTTSHKTSGVGLVIANNKLRGELIAKELGIAVPADTVCHSFEDALHFLETYNRIVLKPLDNSGGNGVSTQISDIATLRIAYDYALEYGNRVIAQQHIDGSDVRLLVVAGIFRSAVERRPASVIGDGILTIDDLIRIENNSPDRSDDYMTALSQINSDSARRFLGSTMNSVPGVGERISVVGPANLSLGGTAHEATHVVGQAMIADAEKVTRKLGLDICGVDMMWDRKTDKYFLIEVNATPGIDMHNDLFWGTKSDAATRYVSWLLDPTARMI